MGPWFFDQLLLATYSLCYIKELSVTAGGLSDDNVLHYLVHDCEHLTTPGDSYDGQGSKAS